MYGFKPLSQMGNEKFNSKTGWFIKIILEDLAAQQVQRRPGSEISSIPACYIQLKVIHRKQTNIEDFISFCQK
jgi:hypothetical protein